MPNSVEKLEQEAIQAALRKEWSKAVELNQQIIDFDSENIPALNRLSKAYLELHKFEEAKKHLKLVLKLDPINQTAKKNMELAVTKRTQGSATLPDVKDFIKEPGTTKEFKFQILAKGLTSKKFYLGEEMTIELNGHKATLHKASGELVGFFDPITAEKLISCHRRHGKVKATYISCESEKEITILVKSSLPLFKSEKQDIRPFLKRESVEDDSDSPTSASTDEDEEPQMLTS